MRISDWSSDVCSSDLGPCPCAYTVYGGHYGLGTSPHRLDQITRHACEIQQFRHAHVRKRANDLMHIASRAKVASRSRHDHSLDIGGVYQPSKQVTDFGIITERQGILALRPVKGQCGTLDIGGNRPQKEPGLV